MKRDEVIRDVALDVFETDWQRQWLVERGVEIISEASRHLTDELKDRHPEIPWQKVAGIGNVLRHNYESIAAPVIWKLAPRCWSDPPHGLHREPGSQIFVERVRDAHSGR